MAIAQLNSYFETHKETSLFHRYITLDHISPLLNKHENKFAINEIGTSVLGEPIHAIKIGNGNLKILMWSQMHGNESTTTKSIFDLCNLFAESDSAQIKDILNSCTIAIIPMLNPDGAKAYTRLNANEVDLNRDAKDLSQPESRTLKTFFNNFKPDFCFNLHGQRTIFSAGKTNFPASVSFLAPAQDEKCTITKNRKVAMEIIVVMNTMLQEQIPNQVGIYDDTFNINCVGDMFQSHHIPTILFEAGHFPADYSREETRKYIFHSLLTAIQQIALTQVDGSRYDKYFEIPQNEKLFYDVIIRNASINFQLQDIAIQYQEKLTDRVIEFIPKIEKISALKNFYGHREINADGNEVTTEDLQVVKEGLEIDFVLINNQRISLILKNS